ncbi:anti-sigma factor [uncultured Lacinutrix sp.]|uniref:anti-sigma factor n=1 Tax=uncultured Lacinutrix sp. TaxID=574032 RepID=UPI00260D1D0A|nr:anti-sigma factor [uncultured Lacinutrix sp.]
MIKRMILGVLALGFLATSCSNDDDAIQIPTNSSLTVDFSGLEALGSDYVYEGWIIVNGAPVSTGTFSSVTFPQTFQVSTTQLAAATKFVLSIEPAVDPDPLPADTKILEGDFAGDMATLDSNEIVGDFSTSTGEYILATPTDNDMTNESSGVWFLNNSGTAPVAGLSLPTLQPGWKYEGWAVIDGTPLSTGTFTNVAATDDLAPYSGPVALPMPNGTDGFFPGEDFLLNAPTGMTFPVDLKGKTIVISVEPSPDNSPAPFTLKPLAHVVPATAMDHTPIGMGVGPVQSLSGSVTR